MAEENFKLFIINIPILAYATECVVVVLNEVVWSIGYIKGQWVDLFTVIETLNLVNVVWI